jgi:hypothetical protein
MEPGWTGPGCWAQRSGTTGPTWKNQRGKEWAAKTIWAKNKIENKWATEFFSNFSTKT